MKTIRIVLWVCIAGCFSARETLAAETPAEPVSLYIGIESNQKPYSYFDDNQQPQGFLVSYVKTACQQLEFSCKFVGKEFYEMLQDLRNIKLNAVLVVDKVIPPDAHDIKLTQPLCHIKPVFLQKEWAASRKKLDDFKGTTLGVLDNSVFQSYLALDQRVIKRQFSTHYEKEAERIGVKAYPSTETAIIDLVFGRLDAVLADDALFQAQVFGFALGEYEKLTVTPVDTAPPFVGMALALRGRDTDLLNQLNGVFNAMDKNQSCAQLLATSAIKPVETNN